MNGHLGVRSGSSQKIRAYSTTRPFLEYHIRRRLRAMPNIALLEAHDFVDVPPLHGAIASPAFSRLSAAAMGCRSCPPIWSSMPPAAVHAHR
jgi:hypothetical protein